MKPYFSIIVPVYNVEEYLERCIKSLLNQTYKAIEIILVDDGSSDNSGNMCDEYSNMYENVITIHKQNGGLASARNEGLKYANGDYISYIDSDDWVELTMYETIHDKLEDNDSDILVFGYQKINRGKIVVCEHAFFKEGIYGQDDIANKVLPDSISQPKAFNQVNLPVQLSACMCVYRKDFLKSESILFESERIVLNEDWLFNIKCLCRAKKIEITHDIFYNYDTRENSLSMSYKSDSYERKKNLYKRYYEEISITNHKNSEIQRRLCNFWLECIYNCVVIELLSGQWEQATKNRLRQICADKQFVEYQRNLKVNECTIKGWVFIVLMKLGMFSLFRWLYFAKQKNKREKQE